MTSWLEVLLSYILQLWPFARLKPWEHGLRVTYIPFRAAKVRVLAGPRIIRDIPFFDELMRRDMREDTYNLPTQSITTRDGKGVSFSANFVFEVVDAAKALANVKEFDSSLQDVAMLHLSDRMRRLDWNELLAQQRELETSLRDTLTTKAKDWGVRILRVGFTDLVATEHYRLFGDTALSGVV